MEVNIPYFPHNFSLNIREIIEVNVRQKTVSSRYKGKGKSHPCTGTTEAL
jgi:hypothetical protein